MKRPCKDRWLFFVKDFSYFSIVKKKSMVEWQRKSVATRFARRRAQEASFMASFVYTFSCSCCFLAFPQFGASHEMLAGKLLSTMQTTCIPRRFLGQPSFCFVSFDIHIEHHKIQSLWWRIHAYLAMCTFTLTPVVKQASISYFTIFVSDFPL